MYVLQVYNVNGGEVCCRWNKCNDVVEIFDFFLAWLFLPLSYLRNLVSCPPALLEMLLPPCSTSNSSDFCSWLRRRTKRPKYHTVCGARYGPK